MQNSPGEMTRIPLPTEREPRGIPTWAIAAFFVLALIGAVAFNLWLDSGCDITGVVTSDGKACI